jgi:hypothetical protein
MNPTESYIGAKVVLERDDNGHIIQRGRVCGFGQKRERVLCMDYETPECSRYWREQLVDYVFVQVEARVQVDGSKQVPIYEFHRDDKGEIREIPGDSVELMHKYPALTSLS